MSIKCSVFIATSFDGFIARKDGDIGWLNKLDSKIPKGEDCGYFKFIEDVDALVMGRNSFEKVLSFGVDWPYEKPVIVLSSKKLDIPENLKGKVTHSNESPIDLTKRLESEGLKKLYIDGGVTIQRFINQKLINDMVVTLIPIILGEGLPLFGTLEKDIDLRLIESKDYDFGFVQVCYEFMYQPI